MSERVHLKVRRRRLLRGVIEFTGTCRIDGEKYLFTDLMHGADYVDLRKVFAVVENMMERASRLAS